jgi:hypothetical protein
MLLADVFAQIVSVKEVVVQKFVGEAEFLGVIVLPGVKSAELTCVSWHPFKALVIHVEFEGAGAELDPSEQLAVVPKPTKSITLLPVGHVPDKAVVEFTNAILPAVPAMKIVPIWSGVGNAIDPPAPAAICTKK